MTLYEAYEQVGKKFPFSVTYKGQTEWNVVDFTIDERVSGSVKYFIVEINGPHGAFSSGWVPAEVCVEIAEQTYKDNFLKVIS